MCSLIGWSLVVVLLASRTVRPVPDETIAPAVSVRAVARP